MKDYEIKAHRSSDLAEETVAERRAVVETGRTEGLVVSSFCHGTAGITDLAETESTPLLASRLILYIDRMVIPRLVVYNVVDQARVYLH